MKKILIFIITIIVIILALIGSYFYMISSISSKSEEVSFYVEEGQTYSTIVDNLKKKDLIRSKLCYKIYLKLNNTENDLDFGEYILNKNMNIEKLLDTLKKGPNSLNNTKTITFIEGKNMRYIIKTITSNFNISEKEILDKLKDNTYLDNLIQKYWFLTSDIKNKDIYYSLEGYLYPDTYEYYKTASVEDIFAKMLDNMESKLESYKSEIQNNKKYSIHQMLTLASIIDQEANTAGDRKGVAGVFYNRLEDNWSLGSDVTTYYAAKIDNYVRDLTLNEINECNNYNTRSSCMAGKLPIGPICNPSFNSIVASIEPTKHDYYYFVADKNGKTYFNQSYNAHQETISKLKSEGLWIEYEE